MAWTDPGLTFGSVAGKCLNSPSAVIEWLSPTPVDPGKPRRQEAWIAGSTVGFGGDDLSTLPKQFDVTGLVKSLNESRDRHPSPLPAVTGRMIHIQSPVHTKALQTITLSALNAEVF